MDIAKRFDSNPIISPDDIKPSIPGAIVECVLNSGVFRFNGKTCLLLRIAERYEQKGFFGNVVFTNGHIVVDDTITLYYGASDSVICGATLSIKEILDTLQTG